MRQPEMSHSPAYYQDNGQLVTAHLPDTPPAAPSAAHVSPHSSVSSKHRSHRSNPPQGAVGSRPSSKDRTPTDKIHSSSDQWHSYTSHSHPPYPHNTKALGESIYPDSGPPAVAPVTNGGVRKEERVRGSWTDHSSYMSGDNHHAHGATRVPKRPIPDDEPFADDSQDALVLLFRLSLPIPIFSFLATLYTVFGLFFVIMVSPFRLCACIPYLRKTSFRAQLCDLLVPQLHVHERLVRLRPSSYRSSSTQSIYNDPEGSESDPTRGYSMGGLIAVLLCSSLASLVFLLLAWTAAFFWIFAMILGNPDGTERRDDGRAAVLGVCKWWQIWLGKARKAPR
ncbi:hypothetical protein FE257_009938 [Aspergillus nanangensis]|uniref:Uncharacterized protein n=1 Tax=Aspergillus nanangensis TaxID=2582783 RepID=A0AAD4CWH9_ASPNN|nr:hypothetical protein FE257_009938 [Aspergillus nanangensis]